jgi:hypothetical protein
VPKDERKCIVEHEREVKRFFVSAQKKRGECKWGFSFLFCINHSSERRKMLSGDFLGCTLSSIEKKAFLLLITLLSRFKYTQFMTLYCKVQAKS